MCTTSSSSVDPGDWTQVIKLVPQGRLSCKLSPCALSPIKTNKINHTRRQTICHLHTWYRPTPRMYQRLLQLPNNMTLNHLTGRWTIRTLCPWRWMEVMAHPLPEVYSLTTIQQLLPLLSSPAQGGFPWPSVNTVSCFNLSQLHTCSRCPYPCHSARPLSHAVWALPIGSAYSCSFSTWEDPRHNKSIFWRMYPEAPSGYLINVSFISEFNL